MCSKCISTGAYVTQCCVPCSEEGEPIYLRSMVYTHYIIGYQHMIFGLQMNMDILWTQLWIMSIQSIIWDTWPLLPLRDLVATSSGFKTTAIMDGPLLPLRDLAATSSGFKTTSITLLVPSRNDRLQRACKRSLRKIGKRGHKLMVKSLGASLVLFPHFTHNFHKFQEGAEILTKGGEMLL